MSLSQQIFKNHANVKYKATVAQRLHTINAKLRNGQWTERHLKLAVLFNDYAAKQFVKLREQSDKTCSAGHSAEIDDLTWFVQLGNQSLNVLLALCLELFDSLKSKDPRTARIVDVAKSHLYDQDFQIIDDDLVLIGEIEELGEQLSIEFFDRINETFTREQYFESRELIYSLDLAYDLANFLCAKTVAEDVEKCGRIAGDMFSHWCAAKGKSTSRKKLKRIYQDLDKAMLPKLDQLRI